MENNSYQQIIETLQAWLRREPPNISLGQASEDDIQWLRSMHLPDDVIQFYSVAEPSFWIENEGVEIGSIAGLQDANTQVIPGVTISRYGYIVIAKCISGDVYCLDTNQSIQNGQTPIYIASHDKIKQTASKEEVRDGIRLIADNFIEFLNRFISGELPYDFDHIA